MKRSLLFGLMLAMAPMGAAALPDGRAPAVCAAPSPPSSPGAAARDGRRDFDFEFGAWRTHLLRLESPLSGSSTWVEYEGTSIVHPFLDGRANLVELDVEGPAGRIAGLSLRLYNPQSGQWSLHYASVASGALTTPAVGAFDDAGCGEFYAQETFNGRAILVRFVITDVTADSARFEQAFSADGGRTWEVNWIAVDTRIP